MTLTNSEEDDSTSPKLDKDKIKAEEFKRKTKQEVRKEKELDEARKAGTAPAEVDEEGRDINPHIPQFIVKAPWYLGIDKPTLKHQKPHEEKQKNFVDIQEEFVNKGVIKDKVITKFRKGACENCGAITHKKRDCLERPRKIGARYSGHGFGSDEYIVPTMDKSFEGKRDRWVGYDTSRYRDVISDYDKLELAKAKLKADRLEKDVSEEVTVSVPAKEEVESAAAKAVGVGGGGDDSEDEFKVKDDQDVMTGTKWDSKQRMTVRNLRIREDTAKYLYNLDPNSAYYDPKARSMRENPFAIQGKDVTDVPYAGDNFVRYSGDASNIATSQLFAWESSEKGTNLHLQSEPTKLEMMKKHVEDKKSDLGDNQKSQILEKYGGKEHLEPVSKSLLLAQTETYTEYAQDGSLVRGRESVVPKSIYPEDVLINNHTSVWGSYWREGEWGYACCNSFIRNSYCIGESGKLPPIDFEITLKSSGANGQINDNANGEQGLDGSGNEKTKKKKKSKKHKSKDKDKHDSEEESEERDRKKISGKEEMTLEEALKKEEEKQKEADKILATDERKRKYNSMQETTMPTEMEMEAYRMKRTCTNDPMAQFLEN